VFDKGREFLKWIAIGTMTIDHIGAVLYPELTLLRIIGRVSFPIFSYLLVLGVESTRDVKNYLLRLFLFALISQIPFSLALGGTLFNLIDFRLNIFFTLAFGVIILHNPLLIVIPFVISLFLNIDFGIYGLIMITFTGFLKENQKYGIVALLLLGLISVLLWETQIFSLLALPLILLHVNGHFSKWFTTVDSERGTIVYPAWRKYLFYVYYPLHLSVLYLMKSHFF
jgi:hypothetical protein